MANDVKAGGAYVEMFLKDNSLTRGLNALSKRLSSFGGSLLGLGAKFGAAGGSILGLLAAAVKQAVDLGSQLVDTADRLGATTDQVAELAYAADQCGASLEDVEKAARSMQKAAGEGALDEAVSKLGMTMEEFRALDIVEQFAAVADAVAEASDQIEARSIAEAFFGKGGGRLLPLLKQGGEGIRKLIKEGRDLGVIMGKDDAAAAESFGDALDRLYKQLKLVIVQIGSALIGELSQWTETMTDVGKRVIAFVTANRQVVLIVAAVGVALVAIGGVLSAVGLAFVGLAGVITLFTTALGAVASVVGAILTPMGLLVVGILAIVGAALYATGALDGLATTFDGMSERFMESWQAIQDALAAGRLDLAIRIAGQRLEIEWLKIVNKLQTAWQKFVDKMTEGFIDLLPWFVALAKALYAGDFSDLLGMMGKGSGRSAQDQRDIDKRRSRSRLEEAEREREIAEKESRLAEEQSEAAEERSKREAERGRVTDWWKKSWLLQPLPPPKLQAAIAGAVGGSFNSSALQGALNFSSKPMEKIEKNTGDTVRKLDEIKRELSDLDGGFNFGR